MEYVRVLVGESDSETRRGDTQWAAEMREEPLALPLLRDNPSVTVNNSSVAHLASGGGCDTCRAAVVNLLEARRHLDLMYRNASSWPSAKKRSTELWSEEKVIALPRLKFSRLASTWAEQGR